MHIRYKPRINLGIISQRDAIDYAARYAPPTSTVTTTLSPATTLEPIPYTPPIMVPIKPPSAPVRPTNGSISLTPPPGYIGTTVMPPSGFVWAYEISPTTGSVIRFPVNPVTLEPYSYQDYVAGGGGFMPPSVEPSVDVAVPDVFRYTKEQIADMLIRGASETFDRTGESEEGLPIADDLEQKSREIDATKQFGVDADGGLFPTVAPQAKAGQALGWTIAAVVGYFLLGG